MAFSRFESSCTLPRVGCAKRRASRVDLRADVVRALLLCAFTASLGCDGTRTPPVHTTRVAASADAGSQKASSEPATSSNGCAGHAYSAFVADPRMCITVFASNLSAPRQMAFAGNGDLFVSAGSISVLWDADHDGVSASEERAIFATAPNLNHGVAFDRTQHYLYASSSEAVYRWPYKAGQRTSSAAAEVVVKNIPSGGHSSRTLAFDSQGRLYVSVGSASNVDSTEAQWQTRSQIRRFDPAMAIPAGGFDYAIGTVVASGMRNEVGLYFDPDDKLWGVENGRDDLNDADLGGDIHNDNPGEEINLVEVTNPNATTFYGYPHCYSEFKLAGGLGAGTQWADDTLAAAARKTDDYCRDATKVHPPAFSMPAHYAPLGIIRYTGKLLPFGSDLIVTAHGSWDRKPAVGRLLLRAHMEGAAVKSVEPIVGEKGDNGLKEGTWEARPVDVQQGPEGALYFSDDQGGRVFRVGYRAQ